MRYRSSLVSTISIVAVLTASLFSISVHAAVLPSFETFDGGFDNDGWRLAGNGTHEFEPSGLRVENLGFQSEQGELVHLARFINGNGAFVTRLEIRDLELTAIQDSETGSNGKLSIVARLDAVDPLRGISNAVSLEMSKTQNLLDGQYTVYMTSGRSDNDFSETIEAGTNIALEIAF